MKTLPLLAVLANLSLTSAVIPSAIESPPDATQVIERHLEAIGGRTAAEARTSVTISGLITATHRNTPFTLRIKSPGRVLFSTCDDAGKPIRYGRDARARFWQQDANGIRDLEPLMAGELMELVIALFPAGQAALGDRLADAICEQTMENGRLLVTLGRKAQSEAFPMLAFDGTSGLLFQIGSSTLSNYRPAGPLKLPHRILWASKTQIRVASIRFDDTVADDTFERPGNRGGWLAQLAPGLTMPQPRLHTKLSKPGTLEIVRQPSPTHIRRGVLRDLPTYDPASGANWQVDLRGADLTRLELSSRGADLAHADFDSNTRWPSALPAVFNPDLVLRFGQDPGLSIRSLHARGITGSGVGIGIIDQPLLVILCRQTGKYA